MIYLFIFISQKKNPYILEMKSKSLIKKKIQYERNF